MLEMSPLEVAFFVLAGLVLYPLVIYPALMAAIGWCAGKLGFAPANAPTPHELPSVSVIVPAYNEEAVIEDKLRNFLDLDYPREKLEIIVGSDGSSDGTVQLAKAFEPRGVRVLDFRQRRGKPSVLNDAVARARGQLLCLTDANVFVDKATLKRLVARYLAEKRIGAVTTVVELKPNGPSGLGVGEPAYCRFETLVQRGESVIGSVTNVDGGLYIVAKDDFPRLDPDYLNEDLAVAVSLLKSGKRIVNEEGARAWECGVVAARDEFCRRSRIAAGVVQALTRGLVPSPFRTPVFFFEYFSHRILRWFSPIALLGLFGVNLALAPVHPLYAATLALQVGFYGIALLGALVPTLRNKWLLGVPFYFCLAQVAILVGLVRGMLAAQPVTWRVARRVAEPDQADNRNDDEKVEVPQGAQSSPSIEQ